MWRNTHMKRRIASVVSVAVAMLLVGACGNSGIRPSFLVRYYRGIAPGVPGVGEGGLCAMTPCGRQPAGWRW